MARHAIINNENVVTNVMEWDGVSEWKPPEGFYLIDSEIAASGDIYDRENNVFLKLDGKKYKADISLSDYMTGTAHEKE